MSCLNKIYLKLNFISSYNNERFYNLKNKKRGVYFIKENGILVYIGSSRNNCTKTLYRHFQKWNDKRFNRIVYDRKYCEVAFIEVDNYHELEVEFIRLFKPRDNKQLYIQESEINSTPPVEWGQIPEIIPF